MSVTSRTELAARRFERRFGMRQEDVKASLFDYLAITEADHITSLFPRMLDQLAVRGLGPQAARDALHEIMQLYWWNADELREAIEKASRVVVHRV